MSGYIDNNDIDKVREAVDIVEVVSDYVNLKQKRPGDWWGTCPFHQEKTASFHVMSDRGMFHCFGCGKGGNVFSFLMEMEGISFFEAVRTLAERVGIQLRTTQRADDIKKAGDAKDRLYQINRLAEAWFHDNLVKERGSREAAQAHRYLLDRGITPDIIERFKLGWAETGWDGLVKHAGLGGFKENQLVEAGLALRRKDGRGCVDRFRGRIMFPIHNLSGKAVAFGGRILDGVTSGDEPAKYINSPETVIYHKGDLLYGLFAARDRIRKTGICHLVEGYTDLLALILAGLDNAAASLGTALTRTQARLLKRFTNKVVVVYDSDAAGLAAGRRAADVLTIAGIEARLVMLPEGEDPDSLLRTGGAELLRKTVANDLSFIRFHLYSSLPPGSDPGKLADLSSAEKITLAGSLLETIRSIRDPLQRDLLLSELSSEIVIGREALDQALQRLRARSFLADEAIDRTKLSVPKENVAERDLLRALLGHIELMKRFIGNLQPEMFNTPPLKEIYRVLERANLQGKSIDPASLPDRFTDPAVRAFIAESVSTGSTMDVEEAQGEVTECLVALRRRDIRRKISRIEQMIQQAEKEGRPTRDLMKQLLAHQKDMRSVG